MQWQPFDILKRQPVDAVYIHIPFCFHKCHYCDFYSLPPLPPLSPLPPNPAHPYPAQLASSEPSSTTASTAAGITDPRQSPFIERLVEELELRCRQTDLKPKTIFIGGGTPTRLTIDQWDDLLSAMQRLGILSCAEEFTVEANPETVTLQAMRRLADGQVNRISIGAQSFQPSLLKMLERWHDPASVAQAVATARQAGIANINLDLILAIPGQTMAMLDDDLDHALALEPDHLSYYGLTYEPKTPLARQLHEGRLTRIDQETERVMYQRVIDRLSASGFEHYEISNWARRTGNASDRRCRHNLNYWHNRHWLGVGPAAASHIDGHRWRNEPSLTRYMQQRPEPPTDEHEHLPPSARIGEAIMLRLRLRQGIEQTWLRQHLPDETDERWTAISQLVDQRMLTWADDEQGRWLRLTDAGLMVADPVIARLL